MRWFRRKRPAPPIDEAQAYARSYGDRTDVRQVKLPPRRPRYASILLSGEQLRRRFEQRLAERDEERES